MTPVFLQARAPRCAALVIAHRGHSAGAPENSLEALERAIAAGADVVECDVRIAGDQTLVVSHDADLERLTGRAVAVADTPAAVLDAAARDAGASVPTLAALMAAARCRVPLMLDIKSADPAVIAMIAQTVQAARFRQEDLVLGLRSPALVEAATVHLPDTVFLALHGATAPVEAFLDLGVRLIRMWQGRTDAAAIRDLAGRGCTVWVTTGGPDTGRPVGDATPAELAGLLAAGAAGLLLNDPELGRRAVDRAD